MNTLNRRLFLAAGAGIASLAAAAPLALAQGAGPVDQKALMEPPAMGEMALGVETAPVTVIEYASASCPHCAAFANDVLPALTKDYIDTGKMRLIFREFPHNDAAMGAFMVARCAPKEKYFPLIEIYFKTQNNWVEKPLEGLRAIALQAGFTEQTFMACLNNQEVAKNIFAVRQKAEGFGVQGIPTFFINGERYEGENTLEAFKSKIDSLLPA
jgi:protein-disulfide isomerase